MKNQAIQLKEESHKPFFSEKARRGGRENSEPNGLDGQNAVSMPIMRHRIGLSRGS